MCPLATWENVRKFWLKVDLMMATGMEYWMWSSKLGDSNLGRFLPNSEEIQRKFYIS